jgi:uncharacterized 2Fe-2S/4Fe-4S cluster protein (DUF4445 family)
MTANGVMNLCPPVVITQGDIRELQVAKAAIAAGIQILTKDVGASIGDISRIYLAGAFGNYIDRSNAFRIGLLPVPPEKIQPAGNTALLGAKLALFQANSETFAQIKSIVRHVALNLDEQFQDIFVGEMGFPELPPAQSIASPE